MQYRRYWVKQKGSNNATVFRTGTVTNGLNAMWIFIFAFAFWTWPVGVIAINIHSSWTVPFALFAEALWLLLAVSVWARIRAYREAQTQKGPNEADQ